MKYIEHSYHPKAQILLCFRLPLISIDISDVFWYFEQKSPEIMFFLTLFWTWYNIDSYLKGREERMKIDPLLEKELQSRFDKDNRSLIFVTRTKMFIHIDQD